MWHEIIRITILFSLLIWVATCSAEEKTGKFFTEDEQLALVIFIQKLQEQNHKLMIDREEALQERNKMFQRLRKQGTCV